MSSPWIDPVTAAKVREAARLGILRDNQSPNDVHVHFVTSRLAVHQRDLDAVVADLSTVRGFLARFLELVIYGLIAIDEWLRPGMAREILRTMKAQIIRTFGQESGRVIRATADEKVRRGAVATIGSYGRAQGWKS